MIRSRWSLPLLALALLAAPRAARADDCGNVDGAGACLDSKTVVFCVEGHLETMTCPTGEICVVDDRFGGGSGCISTRYTDCGDISEVGECAGGDRAVVWCDGSRVKARACDEGTACAFVASEGWFDCVPVRTANAEPESPDTDVVDPPGGDAGPTDPGGSDAGAGSDAGPTPDADAQGPVPTVEKGGATAQPPVASGGAGCHAGAPTSALALAAAALLLARRRRA